jgi:peptide/nickel transport system substrate-binding protein
MNEVGGHGDGDKKVGGLNRRLFIGGATAGAVVAAARPLTAAAQTTRKTELVISQGGDITHLDPHLATTTTNVTVTFNLFDHLVSRHLDGKLHPSLATEWKLVNPTLWQFKLRPGVKFHNGDPLTSADVKFSIDRTADPSVKSSVVRTIFTTVERVETPDPLVVNFHTKQPDPLLPARLAFYGGQIMPRRYYESVGPDQFNLKPIGSGPVRFTSWVKDDRLVLDAFGDYWRGKPDFDRVVFRPIPETAARIAALLKGEVDVIFYLPPDHADRVAKNPTTKVEDVLFAGLVVLAVNAKVQPLDNPLIKQALSLAIDRESIVRELWRGRGIVPNGPIAKGDNHYDESLPPLAYNPTLAKQKLREGGYKGEEVVIEAVDGHISSVKAMSEAIASMWKDVGINGKVEMIEMSVRAQKSRQKSFKGTWWSDPASTLSDPDGMMWRLLAPGGAMDYWRHPRFDDLGATARFSVDERFRAQAYKEMARIALEHLPWIPIIQPIQSYGLQRYVDWKPYPSEQVELRNFNLKFRRA